MGLKLKVRWWYADCNRADAFESLAHFVSVTVRRPLMPRITLSTTVTGYGSCKVAEPGADLYRPRLHVLLCHRVWTVAAVG